MLKTFSPFGIFWGRDYTGALFFAVEGAPAWLARFGKPCRVGQKFMTRFI